MRRIAIVLIALALGMFSAPAAQANLEGIKWCNRSVVYVYDGTGHSQWQVGQSSYVWDRTGSKLRVFRTSDYTKANIVVKEQQLSYPYVGYTWWRWVYNGSQKCYTGKTTVAMDPSFRYKWYAPRYMQHELGHAIGLAHNTYSYGSVMKTGSWSWNGYPNWYDVKEIKRLYGSR